MIARELELAPVDSDDRDRKVVLRHLQAVLDRDVVRASGVFGRNCPAPGPELEPREAPERASAPGLVAVAPFRMLALEDGTRLVSLRGWREGVHDRLRRFLNQPFAAEGAREVSAQRCQVA